MHGQSVPLRPGIGKHIAELDRGIVLFVGVETDTQDPFTVGLGLAERSGSLCRWHIPQKAQDKLRVNPVCYLGVILRTAEPLNYGIERDVA